MSRLNFEDDRNFSVGPVNRLAIFSQSHEPGYAPHCLQKDSERRPDLKLKSIDLINMLRFLETVAHESDITESQVHAFLAENESSAGDSCGEFRIDAETDDFFNSPRLPF